MVSPFIYRIFSEEFSSSVLRHREIFLKEFSPSTLGLREFLFEEFSSSILGLRKFFLRNSPRPPWGLREFFFKEFSSSILGLKEFLFEEFSSFISLRHLRMTYFLLQVILLFATPIKEFCHFRGMTMYICLRNLIVFFV